MEILIVIFIGIASYWILKTHPVSTKGKSTSIKNKSNRDLDYKSKKHITVPDKSSSSSYENNAPTIIINNSYIKSSSFPDNFVVFDTETTGLSPSSEQIIQLSAIKYHNGEQIESYNIYINPGMHIPSSASKIHGIYDKDVKGCPSIDEILPSFLEFIGTSTLIAHNASFDMRFIQTALATHGYKPLSNPVVDTLTLSRKYISTPNHKLETLKEHLHINAQSHNAIEDCMVTAQVYLYCKIKAAEIKNTKKIAATASKKEATELEIACFDTICKLLESTGRDISILRYRKGSSYFMVQAFYTMCKIKVSSKSRYILIEERYQDLLPKNITTLPSAKSDGNSIRVAFNEASDLENLQDFLIKSYEHCLESLNDYIENTKVGASNLDSYLNGTLN